MCRNDAHCREVGYHSGHFDCQFQASCARGALIGKNSGASGSIKCTVEASFGMPPFGWQFVLRYLLHLTGLLGRSGANCGDSCAAASIARSRPLDNVPQ